jgi:hypothetical protein
MANQIRALSLRQINATGKSLRIIRNESQAPKSKIFCFALDPNQFTDSHRLVRPEGRSRVVTTAGRDAVDARAQGAQAIAGRDEPRERSASVQDDRRFFAYGEAVSFWHPLLVSSWRRRDQARPGLIEPLIRQRRWQKRIRRQGERGISRKTIARGMPGLLRCTCGDYTRVPLHIRTRGCGCIGHPAFPAPSVTRGTKVRPNLGRIAPRECGAVSENGAPSLRGANGSRLRRAR